MKRLVILTVGKTHSGKTTFARALELQLNDSLVIDHDNHAEFINSFYKSIQPKKGPNILKFAITQTIVNYGVNETNTHLILCNANRNQRDRLDLLEHFYKKGFVSIIVNFDIPDHVLQERVEKSQRSTSIFRSASSFMEVLARQQYESVKGNVVAPKEGEADHVFLIKDNEESKFVIQRIINIARNL